ncbi:MAG: hypothetical protein QM784_26235 [Polyangiaceae bacterium]
MFHSSFSRTHRYAAISTLAAALHLVGATAAAEPRRAVVLPTQVTAQLDCRLEATSAGRPDLAAQTLAERIDDLVANAIEDAGMELVMRSTTLDAERASSTCHSELELLEMGKREWVIAPQLIRSRGTLTLRFVVASPDSPTLRVITREVTEREIDVRTIVLVSQLLAAPSGEHSENVPAPAGAASAPASPASAPKSHSAGRGVLVLSSGLLGGAVGYSLQRASGSDDPRLTYPLIALGTGIGVGAAMIAADEWDVSVPEAWYLTAGMLWPATSGLLLARAYRVEPSTDRYVYGLGGAALGVTLSSFAIGTTEMTEGRAMMAHSGGAMGLLLGGLVDMTISGQIDHVPWHGMGYGAGIGALTLGAVATRANLSSSRVLFIDMAAGLGALAGAAAGSPFLFVEDDFISVKRQRAWLSVVGVGALAGAGMGYYLTRHWSPEEHVGSGSASIWPYATPLVETPNASGTPSSRGMTLGVQGLF